ncbi:phosphatase PAP2 family protein [Rhodopseudomonas palustris]|uniref:Phosphoesterase, PA-phosphatase related n=1 Tax=Rhodopseudomonas palustris (strain BisB5) TaxID=316057 RepID=Q137F5_RHOPS|nr:phosphoesterase, PA-phosphatase related [Rhodopseudomonas palustris BisB5]MBB1091638.1 phosphatase PAP2 family protein [Rhodopseudomonas palustris]
MRPGEGGGARSYPVELISLIGQSLARLVRAPSHSRRAVASRRWALHMLLLSAVLATAIVILMVAIDAFEIGLMPKRGTPSLWPVKIFTDFGKAAYVLWTLAALMIMVALLLPRLRGVSRAAMIGIGTRVQFVFLAVLAPVLAGEVLKGVIGRGRPFVGGAANPFNFATFSWDEAYSSLPSGHATVAFALAFAVSALFPRLRTIMLAYAIAIALSRLVLLAHHPSDVVAGALLGTIGALAVRYWFAARRLAFAIRPDGAIEPLPGPSWDRVKRVARDAVAP